MPKTIQKANPAIEFANDRMLQQLHKARIKIYSDVKNNNAQSLKKYFLEKSKEFRNKKSHGSAVISQRLTRLWRGASADHTRQ
jgi:hypothetical protein